MKLLWLLAAAAVAAGELTDDETHPVVELCILSGFSAETCAAVEKDCETHGNQFNCYDGSVSPYFQSSPKNAAGCIGSGNSFKGAPRESTLVAGEPPTVSHKSSPSFPEPYKFEKTLSELPGMTCNPPCTSTDCDQFCDGVGCAAHCSGSSCAGGCTGDLCAYYCTGNRCGAGSVGRMAAEMCGTDLKSSECGTGCSGGACAARCNGHGCGTMCTGRYCANICGDGTNSIGCGAHCVGENCAAECQGLGCRVGARDKATDPFTTTCGDYKYKGHCGKLTALAGLRCAWRDDTCVDDPPGGRSAVEAGITAMTVLTTTALVGSAMA